MNVAWKDLTLCSLQKRFQSFKVGVGVQHLRVGDVEKSVIGLPSLE